jgi:hypothetical protein
MIVDFKVESGRTGLRVLARADEPGDDPLHDELQATLRRYDKSLMATGEDLFSVQDGRNLIR